MPLPYVPPIKLVRAVPEAVHVVGVSSLVLAWKVVSWVLSLGIPVLPYTRIGDRISPVVPLQKQVSVLWGTSEYELTFKQQGDAVLTCPKLKWCCHFRPFLRVHLVSMWDSSTTRIAQHWVCSWHLSRWQLKTADLCCKLETELVLFTVVVMQFWETVIIMDVPDRMALHLVYMLIWVKVTWEYKWELQPPVQCRTHHQSV